MDDFLPPAARVEAPKRDFTMNPSTISKETAADAWEQPLLEEVSQLVIDAWEQPPPEKVSQPVADACEQPPPEEVSQLVADAWEQPPPEEVSQPVADPWGQPPPEEVSQPVADPWGQPPPEEVSQPVADPWGQHPPEKVSQPPADAWRVPRQEGFGAQMNDALGDEPEMAPRTLTREATETMRRIEAAREVFVAKPQKQAESEQTQERQAVKERAQQKENHEVVYDGVLFSKINQFVNATFFADDGRLLVDNETPNLKIIQRIIPRLEQAMAHITLSVAGKPVAPRPNVQAARKTGTPKSKVQPAEATPTSFATLESADGAEYQLVSAMARINFESFTNLRVVDLQVSDETRSEEGQVLLRSLPKPMQEEVRQLNARDERAMYFEIAFDPDRASYTRVCASTPEWAAHFADTIKTGRVHAIASISENTPPLFTAIEELFAYCKEGHENSPLNQFHRPGRRWQFQSNRLNVNPGIQAVDFAFNPRTSFFGKDEYMTVFGIEIESQRLAELEAIGQFGANHRIVFQKLPGANDRAFLAYLKLPPDNVLKLGKGTKIKINMGERNSQDELIEWTARVTSEEIAPADHAALVVHRPWDSSEGRFVGTVPQTLDPGDVSNRDMHLAIMKDPGVDVALRIEDSDRVARNLLHAVEDLNFTPANKNRTDWNDNIDQVLLCNRFDKLPSKDAFAAVRTEFPDVKQLMSLNDSQSEAIVAMEKAPAGLTVVNGPPGTGKSRLVLEVLKPFFRSKKNHTILVASPSNSAVNAIADNIDKLMSGMKERGEVSQTKYGLRAHSKGTESALRRQWARDRKPVVETARPPVWDTELAVESLNEINATLYKTYKDATYAPTKGINDPRLELPHLSIGRKMLEIAGVIEGPATAEDTALFADFRQLNQQQANGQEFDADTQTSFKNQVEALWYYTVKNASFIVGTTSNMGSYHLLDVLKKEVRVIMVDEAAHEREDHLIPFFAANFARLDAFIQVGDWLQLLPTVTTNKEQSLFREQGLLSFMTRLVSTGFPICWLTEQHRMVEEIADMANELTYFGKLTTAPDAKLVNRQVAQSFRRWARKWVNLETNFFLIDMVKGEANVTTTGNSQSRFNDLFVMAIGMTLASLLASNGQATVAVLTGYNAQKLRLLEMCNGLAKTSPGMSRVTVDTFDASQGQQYDYVILDILVDRELAKLGFQSERHRMNVAMTRARNGMVVFADVEAIRRCKPARRSFIDKFINKMSAKAYKSPVYTTLPKVDWYQPLLTMADAGPGYGDSGNEVRGNWNDEYETTDDAKGKTTTANQRW